MLDSKQEQNRVVVCRRPRVSTTVDRRKAMQMKNTVMIKKNEVVIKRAEQPNIIQNGQKQVKQKLAIQPHNQSQNQIQNQAKLTAKELKVNAIEKALASAAKTEPQTKEKMPHIHFGFKRILLALVCSAAAVFAIVYFVNLNAPNISLKVAAMQTGIEASYPTYVPRDFNLSDIASEDGKITLNFKNSATGESFSLVEEKSSWDTNTLLNNFVRKEYSDNYVTVKEQGLTLYISGSDAAWVNGGVIYKLRASPNSLTKKQIKSIAVSL